MKDVSVPRTIDWALLRVLSADPTQRFSSAMQFKEALQLALDAPARVRRARRLGFVAAACVVTLAVGAGAFQKYGAPLSHRGEAFQAEFDEGLEDNYADQAAQSDGLDVQQATLANVSSPTPAAPESAVVNDPAALVHPAPLDLDEAEAEAATPPAGEASQPDEVTPNSATRPSADVPEQTLPAEVLAELERATKLSQGNDGDRHTALEVFRKYGELHPKDARVLAGWSQAASRAKWWGESLRVAIRWAAMDSSTEAQLNLAKTQRLVGQRYGAIQTLERLLEQEPSNEAAQAMLRKYRQN